MTKRYFYTLIRILVGAIFILAGMVGFVLPVLPGILIFLLGLVVLFGTKEHIRELRDFLKI